ncbi:Predicted small secreted protein [Salinihabitans flavidus]|uniref:Predicted small secreted protein n=1 Tax=Salinihabitans flavidus TaxID=569882 RepID=A0A1H8VQH8_9RHOB|nr:entericidin A/B family lipoprotein [Salinihabitans flavidus]SEP17530.1 Predicted small secreted protein [Salinihabitans flavidus]
MLHKHISLLSLLAVFAADGCETVEGAGQDIEKAGEAISDTARQAEE